MTISLFGDMCDWTTRETLFIHKNNDNLKIVKRDYGFGATDSTPAMVEVFQVRQITKYFIQSKEITLEELEEGEWNKVN